MLEPPDLPVFRAQCKDCGHHHLCPCGKIGYCDAYDEWTQQDEVVSVNDGCDYYDGSRPLDCQEPDYIPAWELDE